MNGESTVRTVARTVITVVAILIVLYLIYLARQPIGWLLIAVFLAIALSGPVNYLQRFLRRRGLAITVVYIGLLLIPVGIGAIVVPPIIEGANDLADNAPEYSRDVTKFVNENETLRKLDDDYDITAKLEEEAAKLPEKIGDAAVILSDVGLGVVNSIFQLVTILILTAFMLGGGRRWIHAGLLYLDVDDAERVERVLDRSGRAVGNYVAGALFQATIAAVTAYLVLSILGVPFAAPLSLIIFFLDLIPLIGATLGAVVVGIVTLFTDFPTATIVWAVYSIVYQQIENNLIQPQIQKRAVDINPFAVVVAVLLGAAYLGVVGALVAVPVAASIQIAIREWAEYRGIRPREHDEEDEPPAVPPEGPPEGLGGGPEPAPA